MSNCMNDWCISIIGWIGCVTAFCVAWNQWQKGQRVQRADFLERLIQRFKDTEYGTYLRSIEEMSDDSQQYSDDVKDESEECEFLTFISYVCYLKNTKVINDNEFLSFACYVDRALQNPMIIDGLRAFHFKQNIKVSSSPYFPLLQYGKNKFDSIGALCNDIDYSKIFKPEKARSSEKEELQDNQSKTITVAEDKSYRTHLDVLNGVFNKGILFHMKATARLDENTLIWFPHVFKDKNAAGARLWLNTMADDGSEIREVCTNTAVLQTFLRLPKHPRRYVFAKFHDGNKATDYKFMGIYEFKRGEEGPNNEFCWVYERTAVSFKV